MPFSRTTFVGACPLDWLAIEVASRVVESGAGMCGAVNPKQQSYEEALFWAINHKALKGDRAEVDGLFVLTAHYRNKLRTADSYYAQADSAVLAMPSERRLAELIEHHDSWFDALERCFRDILSSARHHHTFALRSISEGEEYVNRQAIESYT